MRCEIFVHANTRCRKKARYIAVSWEGLLVRYVCANHLPKGVEAHLIAPNNACSGREAGPAEEAELYREQLAIAHEEVLRKASRH